MRERNWKSRAAVLIACLIMVNVLANAQNASAEENTYTPHTPIRINGNAGFAAQAAAEGWPGDGSEGNPYVIEGYEINGTGHGYCIYVGNTTVHFVVGGCYVHNASGNLYEEHFRDIGVYFWNVQNGNIENNTISNNNASGIRLYRSNYINIINNNVTLNRYSGIYIYWQSEYNIISGNIFADNRDGISVVDTSKNYFYNNIMAGNGIYLDGFELVHFNSQDIDTSNTVNGKPVYYLKDMNGGTVPENSGQVILVNCRGVTVQNQNIYDVNFGISLHYSFSNTISNNTILVQRSGIRIYRSESNTIFNNNIYNTDSTANDFVGIYLWDSYRNAIIGNSISGFSYGIEVTIVDMKYDNNEIKNNTFNDNGIDYELNIIVENGGGGSGTTAINVGLILTFVGILVIATMIWKKKKNRREGE